MQLTKLRQHTVPNPAGSSSEPGRYTLNGSVGPHAMLTPNRIVVRGHQRFYDYVELQLPDVSGPASVVRWFEPTNGQSKAYDAAYRAAHPGAQAMVSRGIAFMDGLFWGINNLYYNVRPDTTVKTHWASDGTTFRGFARTDKSPLRTGGRIGPLSKQLRDAWGHDTFCFECTAQNTSASNGGPACYTYNRNPNLTDGDTIPVTIRFEHPSTAKYPGWSGDTEIVGACSLPTCMAYTYRKPLGARWYGDHNSLGQGKRSPEGTLVDSLLNPETYAKDVCDSANKGYHAEAFIPVLLTASNESILAGNPVWEETDLRPYGFTSKCSRVSLSYDAASGLMTMVENGANGVLPVIHVFKVKTESEMQAEIDALQAAYNALIQQHTAELAAKDQTIAAVTAQRDTLQAKVSAALTILQN